MLVERPLVGQAGMVELARRSAGKYAPGAGCVKGGIGRKTGGPNGIRTRVLALRGPCPRPLDDGAGHTRNWLGEEDSNPRYQGQNLVSYP